MAKKRGGLAGIYDRNKKYIKTLAPIAAGFIPGVGPAIGAALGAAMGADTEGKGYFKGFDVGGAVKGGLSGYGGAKLGQAAKGGLGKLFTGGVSPVDKLTGAPSVGLTAGGPSSYGTMGSFQPTMAGGAGGAGSASVAGAVGPINNYTLTYGGGIPSSEIEAMRASASRGTSLLSPAGAPRIGQTPLSAATGPNPITSVRNPVLSGKGAMADLPEMDMASKMRRLTQTTGASIPAPQMGAMPRIASQVADKPLGRFAQASKFAKENKDLIAMAGKGIQAFRPDAASDAAYMNAETARMRLDDERNQMKMEEERRRRMAELLMPMFTQMQSRSPYGYGG